MLSCREYHTLLWRDGLDATHRSTFQTALDSPILIWSVALLRPLSKQTSGLRQTICLATVKMEWWASRSFGASGSPPWHHHVNSVPSPVVLPKCHWRLTSKKLGFLRDEKSQRKPLFAHPTKSGSPTCFMAAGHHRSTPQSFQSGIHTKTKFTLTRV